MSQVIMWSSGSNFFRHPSIGYHALPLASNNPSILQKTFAKPPLHSGKFDKEFV